MSFVVHELVTASPLDPRAEEHMVRMRDGVRLATDVYLPDAPARHGAVLIRNPYDKSSKYTGIPEMAKVFNDRGFVVVGQDCRGKFRSEGATLPYASDVADAFDTVEWMIRQPWSNGRVGLHGVSYLGYTVWAGVASGHPAIKGAVPQGTGIDMANMHVASLWRQTVPTTLGVDDLVQIWTDRDIRHVGIDYTRRPLADALEEAAREIGTRSAGVSLLLERSRTGETAQPYGARHPIHTTNVPILHWSNWFDVGLGPAGMRDFRAFRSIPGRRDLHYLRAESADHGGVRLEDVPYADGADQWSDDEEYARVASRQVIDSAEFLAPLLQGVGELPGEDRRVRWHTGHAGWRAGSTWPPAGVAPQTWFLVGGETAQASGDGGGLSPTPDPRRAHVRWTHDPDAPVPGAVSPDDSWVFLSHYPDERALGARPDVLGFTTDPVARPFDICGQGSVAVAVTTSGPSMHLFAKLLDVAPDGSAKLVTHGRVVLFAPSLDRLVQIDLDDQAYRVLAGHRLRLHVASSEHPMYLVHPGTDENPWFAQAHQTNQQTLLLGGEQPSRLQLPVLPIAGDRA